MKKNRVNRDSERCKNLVTRDRGLCLFAEAGLNLPEGNIVFLLEQHGGNIFRGCSCYDDSLKRLQELKKVACF